MPGVPTERSLHSFAIPMRTRFRGIDVREGVLLRGPAGWGEFSPFWGYDARESAPWWRCAREAAHDGWPPAVRSSIPVNVTVPAVGPEQAHAIVLASGGCRTAKVKVAEPGQGEGAEEERVAAVRGVLGPGGRIRVDANGAWDVDTAVARIRALDRAAGGLEYVEQPCATLEQLAAVRRRVEVPVAADESIRRAEDPLRVALAGAADLVVLKAAPLSGVARALEVARACGLPVVVSSALDTSVGISAGLALAAALPELPYACGLATTGLFTSDVAALRVVDGHLPVGPVVPESARLRELAAAPERVRWWHERLRRCADLL